MVFAGAKRALLYFSKGGLQTIEGDRKSIGGMQKEDTRMFTNQTIVLDKGDMVYLSTDGLIDQNNPESKRFGTKRLKELLVTYATATPAKQKTMLENQLDVFSEDAQQRDDITFVGIQI